MGKRFLKLPHWLPMVAPSILVDDSREFEVCGVSSIMVRA